MKPERRRSGLLVRELPDELVVYDLERHRAHCLNRTAALVFQKADGTRTLAELRRALGAGAGDELVTLALGQLSDAGLLEERQGAEPVVPGAMSRREGARRIGLAAALLLPAVATIVAPTPAEAAATCVNNCQGRPIGTPCSSFGASPCTETCANNCGTTTCITGSCTDGGGA